MCTNKKQKAFPVVLASFLTVLSLGTVSTVNAASREPINIEADNAKIIEKEGKSVYSGNVVLIQGTTRMTADIVTVFSKDSKLSKIIAKGSPVTYQQVNQPESDDLSGQANVVEYFADDNRLVLTENAKLTQGRTAFSGNRIEYNIATEVVTAETSESSKERVQVTIQPDQTGNKPKE